MTLFDFILVVILFGFVWSGFWFGMIHSAGALIGTIIGAWLAGQFYSLLVLPIESILGVQGGWVSVLAFLIIFVVINRLVGFGFYVLDRTVRFLQVIPFLKTINRLAGALLGLVEGALVLGVTLYFAERVDLPLLFANAVAHSSVAARLIGFASILIPLLPDIIKSVQPYIPNVNLPIPQ